MDKLLQLKDRTVLEDIMRENNLTQTQLANSVGCTKQEISFVMNGRRRLSGKVLDNVMKHYQQYFSDASSCNTVEIPYLTSTFLPLHNNLLAKAGGSVTLDKQLFDINIPKAIKISSCVIVAISDDTMAPMYEQGDRVVIDTSKTEFINNYLFAFTLNEVCYIRQINLLPNKIKCTSTKREDTFYLTNSDKPEILGLILPRIRF